MPYRIAIQLVFFLLPFIAFGLYVLATADAEREGRRKWPIQALFLTGLALTTAVWFFKIFTEDSERNLCIEPPRSENGQIIPSRTYPCERDANFGVPTTNAPGTAATGVNDPEGLRDPSEISASAPRTSTLDEAADTPQDDP